MQRIKYKIKGPFLVSEIQDIYARPSVIEIVKDFTKPNKVYMINIFRVKTSKEEIKKAVKFTQTSLQNAKRKVRKILKEEFEVNLRSEVRSKLCI